MIRIWIISSKSTEFANKANKTLQKQTSSCTRSSVCECVFSFYKKTMQKGCQRRFALGHDCFSMACTEDAENECTWRIFAQMKILCPSVFLSAGWLHDPFIAFCLGAVCHLVPARRETHTVQMRWRGRGYIMKKKFHRGLTDFFCFFNRVGVPIWCFFNLGEGCRGGESAEKRRCVRKEGTLIFSTMDGRFFIILYRKNSGGGGGAFLEKMPQSHAARRRLCTALCMMPKKRRILWKLSPKKPL